MKKYLNLSMQKNVFPFERDSQKRVQLRIDAINVLNHPNFVFNNDVGGAAYRGSKRPSQEVITAAEYNAWAQYNNKVLQSTPEGNALYT